LPGDKVTKTDDRRHAPSHRKSRSLASPIPDP
jgi:hypothetical protein